MESILENNKKIAEFLEYNIGNGTEIDPIVYVEVPNWYGTTSTKALGWLFFEKDFNMLMQAVDKIESLGYGVEILGNYCKIGDIQSSQPTKIEAVYKAVVEFISKRK